MTVGVAQAVLGIESRGRIARRTPAGDRQPGDAARPHRADPGPRGPAPPRPRAAATSSCTCWWPRRPTSLPNRTSSCGSSPHRGARTSLLQAAAAAARVCSPACAPLLASPAAHAAYAAITVRAAAAAQVFVDDPAHPILADGRRPPPRPGAASARRAKRSWLRRAGPVGPDPLAWPHRRQHRRRRRPRAGTRRRRARW